MENLQPHRVHRQKRPNYPTKLQAAADAELLKQHLPPQWLSHRELAAAAGVFLAANVVGCGGDKTPAREVNPDATAAVAALVAPVFQYGYGTMGRLRFTSMPVAPGHLSEQEALSIVLEELARAGVDALRPDMLLPGVTISGHQVSWVYDWVSASMDERCEPISGPLVADLGDSQRRIYVEYVSVDDFYPLGGVFGDEVDFIRAAEGLGAQVRRQAQGVVFGVFYDPVVFRGVRDSCYWVSDAAPELSPPTDPDSLSAWRHAQGANNCVEDAHAYSRRLLRLQVRDFMDWLKAQGVI